MASQSSSGPVFGGAPAEISDEELALLLPDAEILASDSGDEDEHDGSPVMDVVSGSDDGDSTSLPSGSMIPPADAQQREDAVQMRQANDYLLTDDLTARARQPQQQQQQQQQNNDVRFAQLRRSQNLSGPAVMDQQQQQRVTAINLRGRQPQQQQQVGPEAMELQQQQRVAAAEHEMAIARDALDAVGIGSPQKQRRGAKRKLGVSPALQALYLTQEKLLHEQNMLRLAKMNSSIKATEASIRADQAALKVQQSTSQDQSRANVTKQKMVSDLTEKSAALVIARQSMAALRQQSQAAVRATATHAQRMNALQAIQVTLVRKQADLQTKALTGQMKVLRESAAASRRAAADTAVSKAASALAKADVQQVKLRGSQGQLQLARRGRADDKRNAESKAANALRLEQVKNQALVATALQSQRTAERGQRTAEAKLSIQANRNTLAAATSDATLRAQKELQKQQAALMRVGHAQELAQAAHQAEMADESKTATEQLAAANLARERTTSAMNVSFARAQMNVARGAQAATTNLSNIRKARHDAETGAATDAHNLGILIQKSRALSSLGEVKTRLERALIDLYGARSDLRDQRVSYELEKERLATEKARIKFAHDASVFSLQGAKDLERMRHETAETKSASANTTLQEQKRTTDEENVRLKRLIGGDREEQIRALANGQLTDANTVLQAQVRRLNQHVTVLQQTAGEREQTAVNNLNSLLLRARKMEAEREKLIVSQKEELASNAGRIGALKKRLKQRADSDEADIELGRLSDKIDTQADDIKTRDGRIQALEARLVSRGVNEAENAEILSLGAHVRTLKEQLARMTLARDAAVRNRSNKQAGADAEALILAADERVKALRKMNDAQKSTIESLEQGANDKPAMALMRRQLGAAKSRVKALNSALDAYKATDKERADAKSRRHKIRLKRRQRKARRAHRTRRNNKPAERTSSTAKMTEQRKEDRSQTDDDVKHMDAAQEQEQDKPDTVHMETASGDSQAESSDSESSTSGISSRGGGDPPESSGDSDQSDNTTDTDSTEGEMDAAYRAGLDRHAKKVFDVQAAQTRKTVQAASSEAKAVSSEADRRVKVATDKADKEVRRVNAELKKMKRRYDSQRAARKEQHASEMRTATANLQAQRDTDRKNLKAARDQDANTMRAAADASAATVASKQADIAAGLQRMHVLNEANALLQSQLSHERSLNKEAKAVDESYEHDARVVQVHSEKADDLIQNLSQIEGQIERNLETKRVEMIDLLRKGAEARDAIDKAEDQKIRMAGSAGKIASALRAAAEQTTMIIDGRIGIDYAELKAELVDNGTEDAKRAYQMLLTRPFETTIAASQIMMLAQHAQQRELYFYIIGAAGDAGSVIQKQITDAARREFEGDNNFELPRVVLRLPTQQWPFSRHDIVFANVSSLAAAKGARTAISRKLKNATVENDGFRLYVYVIVPGDGRNNTDDIVGELNKLTQDHRGRVQVYQHAFRPKNRRDLAALYAVAFVHRFLLFYPHADKAHVDFDSVLTAEFEALIRLTKLITNAPFNSSEAVERDAFFFQTGSDARSKPRTRAMFSGLLETEGQMADAADTFTTAKTAFRDAKAERQRQYSMMLGRQKYTEALGKPLWEPQYALARDALSGAGENDLLRDLEDSYAHMKHAADRLFGMRAQAVHEQLKLLRDADPDTPLRNVVTYSSSGGDPLKAAREVRNRLLNSAMWPVKVQAQEQLALTKGRIAVVDNTILELGADLMVAKAQQADLRALASKNASKFTLKTDKHNPRSFKLDENVLRNSSVDPNEITRFINDEKRNLKELTERKKVLENVLRAMIDVNTNNQSLPSPRTKPQSSFFETQARSPEDGPDKSDSGSDESSSSGISDDDE